MAKYIILDKELLGKNPFDNIGFDLRGNDVEAYSKLFISIENLYRVIELSNNGKNLFLYLLLKLQTNQDFILINKDLYLEENNLTSLTTYYTGIKELITRNILAKTIYKEVFWINTRVLFKGEKIN